MNLLNYISRIGKSRGFGIQSPWAYSFVRDVIFEELPYYAYEDIERRHSERKEQKCQKLFFRLNNFAQQEGLTFKKVRLDDFRHAMLSSDTLLVITNTANNYNQLERIKSLPEVGITFDLYHCLICFPPTNERPKQDYKLNF